MCKRSKKTNGVNGCIMNIGVLGYESPNSFTPLISEGMHGEGHMVTQFSINKVKNSLGPFNSRDHLEYKEPYSLKRAIYGYEHKLDFLVVAQSFMHFHNDLKIPVIYFHTELTAPLTVKTPTHLAMKLPEMGNFIHSYSPYEWSQIKHKFMLWPAVHPPHYDPDQEKTIKLCWAGAPSDMFDRKRDWVWNMMQEDMNEIKRYLDIKQIGMVFEDKGEIPLDHPEYHKIITHAEHMVLTSHRGVYLGRRIFECCASKTIPIVWIENDVSQEVHEYLGFKHKKNCYFFREKEELDQYSTIEYDPEIAQNGYDLIMDRHTFGHRALSLLKQVQMSTIPMKSITPEILKKPEVKKEDAKAKA